MKAPIRARVTTWYVVLLAAVLTAVGAFVVLRLRADLTATDDRALRAALGQISAGYHAEGVQEFHDVSQTVLAGEHAAAQILAVDGRVVAWFGDPVARTPMIAPRERDDALADGHVVGSKRLGPDSGPFRIAARGVTRRGNRQAIVAATSLAPVERSVHRVLILLLLALPAAVAVTAAGGWWLARRALRPIDRMTRTAEVIGAQGLSERIPVAAIEDEVAHLGRTLNAMLDRVERAVGEQHRLVSDTSHELRTPLAIMRSEIDVSLRADDLPPAAREVLGSVREEIEHMSAIVEDLLTLASADEGRLRLAREPTDMLQLAAAAAASFRGLAERRRVRLELQGDDAVALADPERLLHAIRNLLANAIDFSPPGGTVRLSTSSADGHAELDVADEGPGIPPGLRDRVFDRFFRADPSRTRETGGRGLGLAIVREVVAAHDGSITAEPNDPRGCRFRLRLPAA